MVGDEAPVRIGRFQQLAIEWVSREWSRRLMGQRVIGRCRPVKDSVTMKGDPEDLLFMDFLSTFLGKNGEPVEVCFKYAGGWRSVTQDPSNIAKRVVEWLVRQNHSQVFGNHKKYTSPHQFPQALTDYVGLVAKSAPEFSPPSQVKMFQTARDFDTLYELIRRNVSSIGHLGSWDYLVNAYFDRSLPSSIAFDFEPRTFNLNEALGPKPGWELVIYGKTTGRALPRDAQASADDVARAVIEKTGLESAEQRPFVWFAIEDLLCFCQKNDEVNQNGAVMSVKELTNDYLDSGEVGALSRLLDALERLYVL